MARIEISKGIHIGIGAEVIEFDGEVVPSVSTCREAKRKGDVRGRLVK